MSIEEQIEQLIEEKVKPLQEKIADLEKRLPKSETWLDVQAAAEVMDVHPDTIYRKIHGGELTEGTEWRRKPNCKKGYQIEKIFAESYKHKAAA